MNRNEEKYLNYYYFFEDLLLTMLDLSLFNKQNSLIFRILGKNIISFGHQLSSITIEKICLKNLFILNILSNISLTIKEEKFKEIISFGSYFISFLSSFIEFCSSNNLNDIYKKI